MRRKYRNKKITVDGVIFDSKREYQRWVVLYQAQTDGLIIDLKRQPKFELLPKITETYTKRLKTKETQCNRTVQLPITYTADFTYTKMDGIMVVEDVKISPSLLPAEYKLKEKLFRYKYGFSIKRVYKPDEPI